MNCYYPLCRKKALYCPVIAVPTIRTKGMTTDMVQTDKPTLLIAKEVCQQHRDTYNLVDWIKPSDWTALQEVAMCNGYTLKEASLIDVRFYPVGWEPQRYMELERP